MATTGWAAGSPLTESSIRLTPPPTSAAWTPRLWWPRSTPPASSEPCGAVSVGGVGSTWVAARSRAAIVGPALQVPTLPSQFIRIENAAPPLDDVGVSWT